MRLHVQAGRLTTLRRAAVRAFTSSIGSSSSEARPASPPAGSSGGVGGAVPPPHPTPASSSPAVLARADSRRAPRAAAAPRFEMPAIKDGIELTEEERLLFAELLDATRQASLDTTLRCAGGWVRDKLMGRLSLDIDIALDNLLGREFAERVNEYLKAHVGAGRLPPLAAPLCGTAIAAALVLQLPQIVLQLLHLVLQLPVPTMCRCGAAAPAAAPCRARRRTTWP